MNRYALLIRLLPAVACLALVWGCEAKKLSQIVVVVDTDLHVPQDLDRFAIKIENMGTTHSNLDYNLDPDKSGGVKLPATLAILAGSDLAQRVTVTVTGYLDVTERVVRRARLPFAQGRALMLRMNLLRKCAYRAKPCPPGTTCTENGCKSIDIDPVSLPDYHEPAANKGLDAALPDLGKDAGPDAPAVDAPRDLSPDAAQPDAPQPDAPAPDAPTPDAISPDAALPDAPIPDAPAPDAPVPDSSTPDVPTMDAAKGDLLPADLPPPDTWPTCTHPPVIKSCAAGWCGIPAGCFAMGSPATEPCRETTETYRPVTLTRPFIISAKEVSNQQFFNLMGYWGGWQTPSKTLCAHCVAGGVSWHEAAAFANALSAKNSLSPCYEFTSYNTCTSQSKCTTGSCIFGSYSTTDSGATQSGECREYSVRSNYSSGGKTIYDCPGYRLPTEAEWEYANRAGTKTAYYTGQSSVAKCTGKEPLLDPIAWYSHSIYPDAGSFIPDTGVLNYGFPRPPGLKQPNAWGLYDVAGNAYEWVDDVYTPSLGTAPATDPWNNNTSPPATSDRVLRGGAYNVHPFKVRAAHRHHLPPHAYPWGGPMDAGIRLVRTVFPPKTDK